MKRFFLLLAACSIFWGISAQQDIYFRINHKLGNNTFQMNTSATNNIGNEFSVRRLQYYISEITLVHDGGTETLVPNTWILADAGQPLDILLGNFNISNLEGVHFGIGVEQASNHLDPSSYQMSHALAPKSPSMHWGWSAGYRFIALEGNSGTNLSQTFEIHCVEDVNYFKPSVSTSGEVLSNGLRIDLNADYEMALKDVTVSNGPIIHGSNGIARTLAHNFRDFVFSPAGTATAIQDVKAEVGFQLYPNPSTGHFKVAIDDSIDENYEVVIFDYTGRLLQQFPILTECEVELNLHGAGCYLVALRNEGGIVVSQRLIVQ